MSNTGGIHVLHVDDEPDFADMVATFLEREDDRITVRTANSPTAGLELLPEHDFDCIVSDYDMPARNGIDFLDVVRERYPELPFILYTGKGSEEIASEAISAGVTDYLQKESGTGQYPVLANRISNAVEQYRSRQAVRETEQKLSELADRTDDVLFMFDGDWNELLFVNSAYEEIWGGSIEELGNNPSSFLENIRPDDREKVRESMEKLSNGEPSRIEYRIVRQDGEQRWVRADSQPVLDENGSVVRIVGQARDITERKERELHLETIIDNLPGYVYRHEYDSEYPLQFVKGDAEAVTGYTATELEKDVVLAEEIIHPDDRETLWSEHLEGIEATGRFDSTYRIITKNGDVRWIQDQGQLIEDPVTGKAVIDGFATDVSNQIQRERELERQQTFIDESLDALQDLFYATNEDGELIRWNDRVSEVCGYTDGEIDEMAVTELFAKEHRDRIGENIKETLETGASVVRADVLTAAGERVPYELRETRLTDPNRGEAMAVGVGRDISDQVKRERELERIRDLFTEAERLGDLGAWEFDADGNVVWTNGTRRIHEVDEEFTPTIEEAIEFIHPEDRETIERAVEDALENEEPYEVELRVNTARGNQRWVRTRGKVVGDQGSRIVRGFIQDITEQKDRERDLQREHERFRAVFEKAFDAMVLANDDGEYIDVNQSATELLGLPEGELLGRTILEFAPDDFDFDAAWQQFQDSGTERGTFPLVRADGTERTAEYAATTDIIPGQHLSVLRDVTAQKEQERRLTALNEVSQELMTTETQKEVTEIGVEAAATIVGLDINAIHLYEETAGLVPVAETDRVSDLIGDLPTFTSGDSIAWRAYEQGEPFVVDDLHADPDIYNPETPIESELYLPLGEYGLLIAGSDTPKAFDQQDLVFGKILAGGVTAALEQLEWTEQLRAREAELARQNERLEQFANVVSHDLRNPLSVAEGRLELAREECDNDHLDDVGRAHERMNVLIDDLLTLAREGEEVGAFDPVDLGRLVENCWQNVDATDATLTVEAESMILADSSRLQQLLENLMRNAVEHGSTSSGTESDDAIEHGTEDVTVTVGVLADGFYVEDDGPGIPVDEREDVFEAGYSTSEGGTGFGLSIVHRVADAHGWEINVTDGSEGGARFEITGVTFVAE